jgi:Protein of unknown function (DUF1236)
MINRFMLSVAAAALIAGTGFANAQGNMGREAPSAGSAAQQSAPAPDRAAPSAATPMNRNDASDSGATAPKSAQSDEKQAPAGKAQRAQGDMKAGPQGEKSAQDNNPRGGDRSKSMNSENDKGSAGKDMKADGRDDRMNAQQKGADSKAASDSKTVGQAGASAKLSGEQRTKITTVIRNQHVAPVTNVNFSISVGTRVPPDVTYHPLPEEVVTIYPEWRGYEFILVGDQIVVVDPRSFEIVAVIEA